VKNLARDNNNIAAATKYIDDGLVEAGVMADDSLKYIQSPVCHWYVKSSEDMVTVRVANVPIYNGELLMGLRQKLRQKWLQTEMEKDF
jgi:hypothetical protein